MPNNSKRKVKVNSLSGHDKSFRNTLTGHVGTLVPVFFDEVIPGSKINLKISQAVQLPPLVSETYMNVRFRLEAFAIPHRLTYANFEDFFKDYPADVFNDVEGSMDTFEGLMPLIDLSIPGSQQPAYSAYMSKYLGNGSLLDYLGYAGSGVAGQSGLRRFKPIAPLVCYHLVWQEWYRNPRVQQPAFAPILLSGDVHHSPNVDNFSMLVLNAPYTRSYYNKTDIAQSESVDGQLCYSGYENPSDPIYEGIESIFNEDIFKLADGKSIFDLRQRNFGLDYFTAAMNEPQQGPEAEVEIDGTSDSFTISSLRMQNSIQQFRDRNGLTSPRYQQQIFARYGVAPSDGVIQRPILIGAGTYDVYSHGVVANQTTDAPENSKNMFAGQLGSSGARGAASGSDWLIHGFEAKEPMYIMVLASLVPEVSYSQFTNPYWNRYIGRGSITDMANGILQSVGPEEITMDEFDPTFPEDEVFAYTDRYSKWMIRNNEIHGEFREGGSLAPFVLQRSFDQKPEFGSEFLEIPTNYLDSAFAVSSDVMGFGYWFDSMIEYKVAMPLQEYAIPTLQDPGYEHGKSITLRKNGQLL